MFICTFALYFSFAAQCQVGTSTLSDLAGQVKILALTFATPFVVFLLQKKKIYIL